MLEVGSTVTNPRTGSEWEIRELSETNFVLRYTIPPESQVPEIAPHYHIGWHEEFFVHSGTGAYELGGKKGSLTAGDAIAMPEQIKHVHPYSTDGETMVIDQCGTVNNPAPNAIRETLGFFFTMFDWEARGKIKLDKIGLPRHPMKFALAGRILTRAGGYDARIPKGFADFGGATLGRVAEALGYEVIDPKCR